MGKKLKSFNWQRKLMRVSRMVNLSKLIIVSAFVWVMAYGTFGVFILQNNFHGINNLTDSFYYTMVTYATVGDNNIYPIDNSGKYFVVTMVIFGFSTFAMFGSVLVFQLVNHLQKMVTKIQGEKIYMKNHIILCGYSVITELLINKFLKSRTPFVLLDNAPHPELRTGEDGNFIFVSVPTRLENLVKANIERCQMIIATSDLDSENILAAVNANKLKQQYNAKFKIVARVLYEENFEVARMNGATDVISPTLMAANAIMDLM